MVKDRVRVVTAEIVRDGRYLITQRSARAQLPLLWEFPGGRVRDNETDTEALQRALRLRVGCTVAVGAEVLCVTHVYDGYDLTLVVYRCELGDEDPHPGSVRAIEWVAPDEFGAYPFPGADQKTVDALLGRG